MPITGDATVITIRALSITDPVYSIVGQIVDEADDGLDGVLVTLSGDASDTYTTGAPSRSGYYVFTGLSNGDYVVTPTKSGYYFTDDHEDVTIAYDNEIADDMVGYDYVQLPVTIDWDDAVVPGAITSVTGTGGDTPVVSSQATPACDTGGYTPSTTPCIYIAQSALATGTNTTRLIHFGSVPIDLSGGLRVETMMYDDQASDDGTRGYRYWIQFTDQDDPNKPLIGFYVATGDGYSPDDLRVIERRSTTSNTILDSDTGGNVASDAKHWFKLRMQLPADLSGNVTCSASAMGDGGYTGTDRTVALAQDWSAFTTGRVSLHRNCVVDTDIKLYVAYTWIGAISDAWPV